MEGFIKVEVVKAETEVVFPKVMKFVLPGRITENKSKCSGRK
jgi:hypothetical protein